MVINKKEDLVCKEYVMIDFLYKAGKISLLEYITTINAIKVHKLNTDENSYLFNLFNLHKARLKFKKKPENLYQYDAINCIELLESKLIIPLLVAQLSNNNNQESSIYGCKESMIRKLKKYINIFGYPI